MTVTPFSRAAERSFWTFGSEAIQRGRFCSLHACLIRSMTNNAVVLGSKVTDFSAGAGGVLMLVQSSTTDCAIPDDEPKTARPKIRDADRKARVIWFIHSSQFVNEPIRLLAALKTLRARRQAVKHSPSKRTGFCTLR